MEVEPMTVPEYLDFIEEVEGYLDEPEQEAA